MNRLNEISDAIIGDCLIDDELRVEVLERIINDEGFVECLLNLMVGVPEDTRDLDEDDKMYCTRFSINLLQSIKECIAPIAQARLDSEIDFRRDTIEQIMMVSAPLDDLFVRPSHEDKKSWLGKIPDNVLKFKSKET